MLEQKINILSERVLSKADAICFCSNGVVKRNEELVMGAGVALAFKKRWPKLPACFGKLIEEHGNHVLMMTIVEDNRDINVVSFPTKNDWHDPSDANLIKQSAEELMQIVNEHEFNLVALPKPGCFNGGLDWNEVKPMLEGIFDDRIVIVHL